MPHYDDESGPDMSEPLYGDNSNGFLNAKTQ